VVFTLPAAIADIAYQNKAVIYDLLLKASSETMLTIAADPKHLGARIGIVSVLHTWGSAMTHHPHVHMIVPGGGFSLDGKSWVSCRPRFFLAVRVLSELFRRVFLEKIAAARQAGELQFFTRHAGFADWQNFAAFLAPYAIENGWSTASDHSAVPRRSCAISRATPTASPFQVAA
jgi:Putative transposase